MITSSGHVTMPDAMPPMAPLTDVTKGFESRVEKISSRVMGESGEGAGIAPLEDWDCGLSDIGC